RNGVSGAADFAPRLRSGRPEPGRRASTATGDRMKPPRKAHTVRASLPQCHPSTGGRGDGRQDELCADGASGFERYELEVATDSPSLRRQDVRKSTKAEVRSTKYEEWIPTRPTADAAYSSSFVAPP